MRTRTWRILRRGRRRRQRDSSRPEECTERSEAQQPVLKATAAGMDDWKAHIKFMQYNKEHPIPTRQRIDRRPGQAVRRPQEHQSLREGDCELQGTRLLTEAGASGWYPLQTR